MKPLWQNHDRTVWGEPGLFQGDAPVKLLFPAKKILRVYNPALNETYQENRHYTHEPGSNLLFPVPGSGICGIPADGIFPDPETAKIYPAAGANAVTGGPDGKLLLFDNSSFFARHQINVDYTAVDGTEFPVFPQLTDGQLPRTRNALAQGKPLSITLIGDSISEGFNATRFVDCPPYQPPYIDLFAGEVEKRSGCKITVRNSAIEGTGCRDAFNIKPRWLEPECDLMIIAYGMNDLAGMSPEEYSNEIKKIMAMKKALHPETEFILVCSMPRNPMWHIPYDEHSRLFAGALKNLSSVESAIANVHQIWCRILAEKDFYDLTGNGVNHPNDYGHRVYSAVLTGLFYRD